MPIFELHKIDAIRTGKLRFLKLVEQKNCCYDTFVNEITTGKLNNFQKELKQIHARMQIMAEKDEIMPKSWFNSIKAGKTVYAYEFKTKHLRLYCVKKSPNIIIVLGGFKKEQKKDINTLKRLIASDLFQKELSKL